MFRWAAGHLQVIPLLIAETEWSVWKGMALKLMECPLSLPLRWHSYEASQESTRSMFLELLTEQIA